jgi:hypothetical protein
MTGKDQSFKALLGGLVDQISLLVRQEIRLAQAEMTGKLAKLQNGAISLLTGVLLAFCALLILLQALVLALANFMPMPVAAMLVGLLSAGAAFVLIRQGMANFKTTRLVPERTLDAVRKDKGMVMEKVNEQR